MKKLILIALLSTLSINYLYGQVGNENINQKNSITLIKAWNRFKKELFLKDINALNSLSCKVVSGQCILKPVDSNCNSFSSTNELFDLFFKEMFPQCRNIILRNKYRIVVYSSIKDKAVKIKYPLQFQIWFTNNFEPGFQFAFIFMKIGGEFKFAGLDSIP